MKRLLLLSLVLCAIATSAQVALPNLTYTGILSSTCSTANTPCVGGVVAGMGGVPALPQSNTGILGTGSALDVPTPNYNAAVITVNGTYTGSTINFEFADASGNFYYQVVCARTDINLLETNETLPSNQTRAYNCPVWGNYRFRVRQSAISTGTVTVSITLTQAAIDPSLVVAASITNIAGASDPCQDVSAVKSNVVINIATATTTALITPVVGQGIYICGYQAVAGAGTNPSLQFEYGTGATCGTGTTVLTGAMATGVTVSATAPGPIFQGGGGNTLFKSGLSAGLCIVSGGTTPNFQGFVTYVQQ